jgi:hypothetical protein
MWAAVPPSRETPPRGNQRIPAEPEPLPAELLGLAELFEPLMELPLLPAPAAPGAVRAEPVVTLLRSDFASRFISIELFDAAPVCWATPGVTVGVGDPGCVGAADCATANAGDKARTKAAAMLVFLMCSSLLLS